MSISIDFTPRTTQSGNPKLPPYLAKVGDDELMLVELQGHLGVECNEESERNGQLVGKLGIDLTSSKASLRIGHHLLEGKVANLPKPLAVLLRSATPSASRSLDSGYEPVSVGVKWDVVAVVKRKLVFAKRPMPIVSSQLQDLTALNKKG